MANKPVDPNFPALPELPIYDERAKAAPGSVEQRLGDGNMPRAVATSRFMSGNLRVSNQEALEVGSFLIGWMLQLSDRPLIQALVSIYYAGMFDGVLLQIAQTECDQKAKVQ